MTNPRTTPGGGGGTRSTGQRLRDRKWRAEGKPGAPGSPYLLVGRVVGLELLVVGELDVDGLVSDDGHHRGIVAHHVAGGVLAVHLQEGLDTGTSRGQRTHRDRAVTRPRGHVTLRLAEQHLVFGLQHQQVGHVPERQAEADHLRLRDVVGELAYVDDLGRRVAFELLAVAAIGCGGGGEEQNFDVLSSVTASERAWSELHMHVSRTGALPSQRGGAEHS